MNPKLLSHGKRYASILTPLTRRGWVVSIDTAEVKEFRQCMQSEGQQVTRSGGPLEVREETKPFKVTDATGAEHTVYPQAQR